MEIVTVSMTDADLEELELLKQLGKFSNRSEVVRHAVQSLMSEHRSLEQVKGVITAVVIAVYYKKGQGHNISSVQHEYRKYIAATIHAHTNDGHCTEVMILTAAAEEVRGFLEKLRSQKKVMKVDISLVSGGK
ncbi:CopG family ribbon-helix-helix protein [Candidatus Thorarchaeota archaeon]|nr:CopG family ribbon-helix-helix protein [Candidatus Thorarchaeota archaeon]TFG98251.1 MAG: CopG family ribbon-helix-helix protein [Candidatus Thorarchaeota archaeon]